MKSRNVLAIIAFYIIAPSLFGCLKSKGVSAPLINVNDSHNAIPNTTIFLEKNVADQSIIALTRLDIPEFEIVTLPNEVNQPVLNMQGDKLAYVRSEESGAITPHSVWVYDLLRKEEQRIAGWNEDIMDIWLSSPSFSYDGQTLIFSITWFDSGIIGLAETEILSRKTKTYFATKPISHGPRFSPDGKTTIVNCPGIDVISGQPGFQICLFDRNGSFIKQITNQGDSNSSYYFTPDGKSIAYSEVEFGGLFKLFKPRIDRFIVMDSEGDNKKEILDWDVGILGFSNDSQQIIFEGRPTPKSPWGIYIINIDGTNLRHLTYFDEFLEEWYSDIEEY